MLQTFQADDMKAALAAMRAQIGDHAIILASETTKAGNVLLRATASGSPSVSPPSASLTSFEARYRDNLIGCLRIKHEVAAAKPVPFERESLLRLLSAHRVPRRLAEGIASEAESVELPDLCLALAAALGKRMRTEPVDASIDTGLLLLGPHGAGKTTVAARLAAQARLVGREVRLTATDVDSAGQRERLETFAAYLGVSAIAAPGPDLFANALTQARENGILLIADSAGFDPRKPSKEIGDYVAVQDVEALGIISATTDALEAIEMAAAFVQLGVKRLVVTGLDLARRKGALATLAVSGLAIAQVTASPYLGQGVDTLTPLQLARALLAPMDGRTSEA